MADFMYFLDLGTTNCTDAGFAKKQYNESSLLYGIAHRSLMQYPGDRMLPIQMAGKVKEKLLKLELARAKNPQQNRLTDSSRNLSKTSFAKGKQCLKQLYLYKHKKDDRTPPTPEVRELW